MAAYKLNYLFKREVWKLLKKCDLLDLKIDDPDKFKDTYNLKIAIKATCSNHVKYDIHDVFTVFKTHQDPNEL